MKLFAGVSVLALLASPAFAETITLNPGDNIQAAINRAQAGDTIALRAGIYHQSLDFSGKHGVAGAPITITSADGQGAARIVAQENRAVIQGNRMSHINVTDLHLQSTSRSGDTGGIKFWGSYDKLHDVRITGNIVDGVGQDAIKIFNMNPKDGRVLVAGNTIRGNWRQEAIDNVSVVGVTYDGNDIGGTAANSGITFKAGSDGVQVINNKITTKAKDSVIAGGWGNSRLDRAYPDEFKDNEAEDGLIQGNQISGDVRLVSAERIKVVGNDVGGTIDQEATNRHMPNSIKSRDNVIEGNNKEVVGAGEWNGETAPPPGSEFDDWDSDLGPYKPPTIRREDIARERLPDNRQQLAQANAAAGRLGSARQQLTRATATQLPSMSMDQLRQQISAKNKAKCD
ncbi:hypothetical protein JL101_036515 (plasmid) [Skermanella rosea]|uniref:hypothetical protein n=1 Tax=Skermanella rosea TaxID=1817965 RepID=UPI00193139CA|nr:hypothetical protein [Skermanella rosea]UEM08204.1 hypothetical protein JL101_036515 [Skermanella rosea]